MFSLSLRYIKPFLKSALEICKAVKALNSANLLSHRQDDSFSVYSMGLLWHHSIDRKFCKWHNQVNRAPRNPSKGMTHTEFWRRDPRVSRSMAMVPSIAGWSFYETYCAWGMHPLKERGWQGEHTRQTRRNSTMWSYILRWATITGYGQCTKPEHVERHGDGRCLHTAFWKVSFRMFIFTKQTSSHFELRGMISRQLTAAIQRSHLRRWRKHIKYEVYLNIFIYISIHVGVDTTGIIPKYEIIFIIIKHLYGGVWHVYVFWILCSFYTCFPCVVIN